MVKKNIQKILHSSSSSNKGSDRHNEITRGLVFINLFLFVVALVIFVSGTIVGVISAVRVAQELNDIDITEMTIDMNIENFLKGEYGMYRDELSNSDKLKILKSAEKFQTLNSTQIYQLNNRLEIISWQVPKTAKKRSIYLTQKGNKTFIITEEEWPYFKKMAEVTNTTGLQERLKNLIAQENQVTKLKQQEEEKRKEIINYITS